MKPCRSMLYIPGDSPGMIQHAPVFGADSILLDLEDAVAIAEKDAARKMVACFLQDYDFKDLIVTVRVNGADTEFFDDDLSEIIPCLPAAVRIPKCNGPADVLSADKKIEEIERANSIPVGKFDTCDDRNCRRKNAYHIASPARGRGHNSRRTGPDCGYGRKN